MRVLIVCEGIWPPLVHMSGTSAIYSLQKSLSKLGFEVHILTIIERHTDPSWRQWFENEEEKWNVHFHFINLDPIKRFPKLNFYISKLIPPFKVLKLHSKHHFQVIHEYSSSPILLRRTGLYKKLLKTSTVHTLCTYGHGFLDSPRFSDATSVDKVICVTRHMKETLLKAGYPKDKVIHLSLGVDLTRFKIDFQVDNSLKGLSITLGSHVILYIGLIEERKGIFTLAEAAPLILEEHPDTTFIVASYPFSGTFYNYYENREKLKELLRRNKIDEKFLLLEGLQNIPALMSIADVFVLPLTTMHGTLGYPLSLLEAMASGKAIVTSNVVGVSEVISNEENGLLFRRSNSYELAKTLNCLLSSPELRKKLGHNAKRDVRKYDLDVVAMKLNEIYRSLR